MHERQDQPNVSGLSRRKFLGALGAAATTGAMLQRGGASASAHDAATHYYQDSFGKIVPAAPDTIALGLYPPPLGTPAAGPDLCGIPGTTYIQCGYTQPNILLIMADQIRAPRWLPSGGQFAIDELLPNLAYLRNASYVFPNYFVAATSCSPSRASLLTGLYAQQTCMFQTQNPGTPYPPSLLPKSQGGFPTIGDVLSQVLEYGNGSGSSSYNAAWIGKWHLSANPQEPATSGNCYQGRGGPVNYGFGNRYCIPNMQTASSPFGFGRAYPSPNGMIDEGNGGDFLEGNDVPDYTAPPFQTGVNPPGAPTAYLQLNDAAIAYAFTEFWAQHIPASPWFLAVSFVNAHDIGAFPYAYGLTPASGCSGDYCSAISPVAAGYLPPPPESDEVTYAGTTTCTASCETETIPAFDSSLYTAAPLAVNGNVPWNNPDSPGSQPYATLNTTTNQYGKPGLQAFFQTYAANNDGSVNNDSLDGWLQFLNYYFWIQASVDLKIGQIVTLLQANGANNAPWNNTIVVFTTDHGDYGGSHNLHEKGGALYDEAINVPLYISYPVNRQNNTSISRYFVCSSVDMLPFFYYLALGNNSWRNNPLDMVYYLNGREGIADAIFMGNTAQQHRLAPGIACANPNPNGQTNQPYILHTSDEYSVGGGSPSHAIAFRTVDVTVNPAGPGTYGGGKLGMYSFWTSCATTPVENPTGGHYPQFEFYEYGVTTAYPYGNYGEIGNQGPASVAASGATVLQTAAQNYYNSYMNTTVQNELYGIPFQLQMANEAALNAYLVFLGGCSASCTG
jgi:arylsulfatase A-like enzyme